MAQKNVLRGSVLMLGTSAHVGWTNLPLRPIFLPLLARLTFELAGMEQTFHSVLAGTPLTLQFEQENRPLTVEVVSPSGAQTRLPTKSEEGQKGQVFRYADTHDIGVYTVRVLDAARQTAVPFSVNVDPDEADPTKIEPEDLKERFGGTALVFAEDPEDLTSTFKMLREGTSLWGWFLTAVLIGLVFETFLSNRLTPKKGRRAVAERPSRNAATEEATRRREVMSPFAPRKSRKTFAERKATKFPRNFRGAKGKVKVRASFRERKATKFAASFSRSERRQSSG